MNVMPLQGGEASLPAGLLAWLDSWDNGGPSRIQAVAGFQHFVETDRELNADELARLRQILDYAAAVSTVSGTYELSLLVMPRPGTQSPWSSKATDIAGHCGLNGVRRIERGVVYFLASESPFSPTRLRTFRTLMHDRMTQVVVDAASMNVTQWFTHPQPAPLVRIPLLEQGDVALFTANQELGLALSGEELQYLSEGYRVLGRDPTDVELMMFAQANSEHCRHKIFNARWQIDGVEQEETLFGMIRHTSQVSPEGLLSAYEDNAAVMAAQMTAVFGRQPETGRYDYTLEPAPILMKVETHNHPTAISPFPGAATGAGGEIRDEAATGQGSRTQAGLTGFCVSHLKIPGAIRPWEVDHGKPGRMAQALDIMLEGPLGGAAYNNEFGRPNLSGYFRTFEYLDPHDQALWGYHKPIMLAGGMGTLRVQHLGKQPIPPGAPIVVLGGPAMLIGLGGGAASSLASGESAESLDFASVQRDNPELQRRCQEVINQCTALGESSPILSIHDVGAGGLSNAVPEIIHDAGCGGIFNLRAIPTAETGLSPMQLWCNEAQERFVLALKPDALERFAAFCERERCPYAVIGHATAEAWLRLDDPYFNDTPVDLPMSVLFGKPPKMQRSDTRLVARLTRFDTSGLTLDGVIPRVLNAPAVADKRFLITIGDRSVGGLVARDQCVGRWQTAVADVAVTASGFRAYTGAAMALGERPPLALIDAQASGRVAVGEALTNIAAAAINALSDVKLSANWMAAAGVPGEDARLFDTVRAVGLELCPALGIAIPVGKDSLSMKTVWQQGGHEVRMNSPLSLVVTAFAPVTDIRRTLNPEWQLDGGDTRLILIDLGAGKNRLGGSVLAQVYGQLGDECPDLDDTDRFKSFFHGIQALNAEGRLLAYHDRSDGGLLVTLAEMAFAARSGFEVDLAGLGEDTMAVLFAEELGAVIQVSAHDAAAIMARLSAEGLEGCCHDLGQPRTDGRCVLRRGETILHAADRAEWQRLWADTSFRMQSLRDNPLCARQEHDTLSDPEDTGLFVRLSFDPDLDVAAPYLNLARPQVAILREQGVNGHVEMAAAFTEAGFTAVDVPVSDIRAGRISLAGFAGLAACGGFSYGDVLGAGGGWAQSILLDSRLRDEFAAFFQRDDSFGLGVCNGCQMLSQLHELIPGAEHWPRFVHNTSGRFEARVVMVEVMDSPSVLLSGMVGTQIPVVVAHGEGRVQFRSEASHSAAQVALAYVDPQGRITERFPWNPNGSASGLTGLTTQDGRYTIMMPHPERGFRTVQNSWHPLDWGTYGPWMRIFRNARKWVG
ncbi:MAG: phosphoribosylformylglycinamidine synthase [Methylococcaceae bacterium]